MPSARKHVNVVLRMRIYLYTSFHITRYKLQGALDITKFILFICDNIIVF